MAKFELETPKMLKKIILTAAFASTTLTLAKPAFASGDTTGCTLPPPFAHLCVSEIPESKPVEVPEPSLVVGAIVVAGGCITRKITQKEKPSHI